MTKMNSKHTSLGNASKINPSSSGRRHAILDSSADSIVLMLLMGRSPIVTVCGRTEDARELYNAVRARLARMKMTTTRRLR